MTYTLVRRKRKTMGIYILGDGRVEVRVPLRCPVKTAETFVASREAWVIRKQQEILRRRRDMPAHPFAEGSTLPFDGREHPLRATSESVAHFDGAVFWIPAALLQPDAGHAARQKALIALYKELATPLVTERVTHYGTLLGLSPQLVKMSRACKRWGSCSGKNTVNFSWMLAAAPREAVEYVVVHELCHMREHNHSARFWQLVAAVLPDYHARQALLRQTERRLSVWMGAGT